MAGGTPGGAFGGDGGAGENYWTRLKTKPLFYREDKMFQCEELIKSQVQKILASSQFERWKQEALRKPGYIVFNNSFFFRQGIKTNKGDKYLSLMIDDLSVPIEAKDLRVVSGVSLNSDFQYFPKDNKHKINDESIANLLPDLINNFGQVGFVLIGNIYDDVPFTASLNASGFSDLSLAPTQTELLKIEDGKISIRELVDEESLWHELQSWQHQTGNTEQTLPDSLAGSIAQALNTLRAEAYARLAIPNKPDEIGHSVLDSIIGAFEEALKNYQDSLEKSKGDHRVDPNEFNNVLRIAYNFTSDAIELLKIIVYLSDLKPVVLFTTIQNQFELSNAFKDLPWLRSQKKGSLKEYEDTIKSARNRAFHRLFPFSKALDVDVTGISFKAKKLRLFPEFTNRKTNLVDFEDRELVEILTQFSRTSEHTVTPVFWKKNLMVIEKTIELLKQLKLALVAILTDKVELTKQH